MTATAFRPAERFAPPRSDCAADGPGELSDPFARLDLGDPAMHTVVQRLRRAARCDIPVLINGETGTGKELFARAVHDAGPRRQGPFVAINCASLPEGLIESELFGHRAGAFTGAHARGNKGLVEQANGGTLFLDEIGDMAPALQSRLLRLLAEHEIRPVGAAVAVKLDLRVISATHRDLGTRTAQGLFREDLLFRLQGLRVTLPPLRQRSDLPALAQCLLEAECVRLGRAVAFGPAAVNWMSRVAWPGNVRQLKQVLGAALWLGDGHTLQAEDLQQVLDGCGDAATSPAPSSAAGPEPTVMAGPAMESSLAPGARPDERSELLLSLRRNRWNVSRTAAEFNAARTTIYRRMTRLGIVQPHLLDG